MQAIFLDLDGTLVDPSEGYFAALGHALRQQGGEVPPVAELGWTVGPPIWEVLEVLLGTTADIGEAVTDFFAAYMAGGVEEAEVQDDVGVMLDDLRDLEVAIYLTSVLPTPVAERQAEVLGLDAHVDRIFGAEISGKNADKTALYAHVLAETGHDPALCIVLGDRRHDIEGARNNDIPTIGALWGFAEEGELHTAEADGLAGAPAEVPEIAADLMGIEL
ncbi:HAD hydrolase-like protein [Pontivivens ytuae]|uniref:HAD hydrolase-like protein n=1 Tax=Pontivivens ytuae TaxID=2789856 RepID=A0A7S9LRN9_9RHOB|nr:HAD hydrolase-like protein [Pontivivens ytuae]QPH54046.1 HAD hydrolase-like protein [Pontivivens ytuae]